MAFSMASEIERDLISKTYYRGFKVCKASECNWVDKKGPGKKVN